jgi:ribosomal protein S6--L-glutamate ligase
MKLVSFDPFRSLRIPGVTVLKPERWLQHRDMLRAADCVLFPEFWQLDALQYALGCHLFPSPATFRLGHDKVAMTRALEAAFPAWMPVTLIRANTPAAREEILDVMAFPFVVKVPRESMGRGVRLVASHAEFSAWCDGQSVLYAQEYLPIDRDLRVVWIGDRVVTAYWRRGVDGFLNNVARGGSVDFDGVPQGALDAVAAVARTLGIDHAGFDVAWLDHHPYILEFNVRFGNQALTAHGIRIEDHIHAWLLKQFSGSLAPLPRSA